MALENERGLGRVGSLRTWLKPSSFFLSCNYGAVYNRALFFCYSRVYNNNNNKKIKKQTKKTKWLCPLNATDPLILNAIKNCSLSLSPLTPFQGLINDKDVGDYYWNVY